MAFLSACVIYNRLLIRKKITNKKTIYQTQKLLYVVSINEKINFLELESTYLFLKWASQGEMKITWNMEQEMYSIISMLSVDMQVFKFRNVVSIAY